MTSPARIEDSAKYIKGYSANSRFNRDIGLGPMEGGKIVLPIGKSCCHGSHGIYLLLYVWKRRGSSLAKFTTIKTQELFLMKA